MRSKNTKPPTPAELAHMARVKELPCSVCNAPAPSEAHHTKQKNHATDVGNHYTTVALCTDCHRGQRNGWHGERAMWRLYKMDENDALNITIKRLQEAA